MYIQYTPYLVYCQLKQTNKQNKNMMEKNTTAFECIILDRADHILQTESCKHS